jgi:DNA-binding beta-propeller fold protein YncE
LTHSFKRKQTHMKQGLILLFSIFSISLFAQNKTVKILQTPAENQFSSINTVEERNPENIGKGLSIIPSGRFITPVGKTLRITRSPFGMAIAPDESKILVWHHGGVLTVIDPKNAQNTEGGVTRIPSYDKSIPALNSAAFIGVVFSKDSKTAYLSGGDKGNIVVFDINTNKRVDSIELNQTFNNTNYVDSWTSDMAINTEKNELYVLDRGNFRLVKIDLNNKKITASIPVGRIPFGIALSPDKTTAFVANVGLYEYKAIPGVTPTNKDSMMLMFPPFGIPSKEAEEGVTLPDGRFIPALGSALANEAMSVWTIDLDKNMVVDKFKTGHQIGSKIEDADIVGGASPNSIAVGSRYAYVSNATNDLISIIDYKNHKIIGEIPLLVDKRLDKYRGLMPFGLTISKDETTLYVALLGFNAVAVVDIEAKKVKGLIPTGWGTTRVLLSKNEEKIYITSARGYGAGANGGKNFKAPPQGTYVGDIQLGTFQIVDTPDDLTLKKWTQQVLDNTFKEVEIPTNTVCPPQYLNKNSPIKHIVYITKENRTFDEVFGQMPNTNADATLARFGEKTNLIVKKDTILRGCNVTPNHHKIARQWSFSDNFYCDSDASIHGHHWMLGQIPNEYVEANSSADRRFNVFSSAPGRRFPGTTGGVDPEDYNEIGGIWENLARNKVSFFNFGQSNEFANAYEEKFDTLFGSANSVNFPLQKVLWDNTSRDYAGYNTSIPDQFRVEQFEREFTKKWLKGKEKMPQFIGLQLPNDHTSDVRPEDGYPYPHSYVADNDLALGRMLTFLSKTPYWKNMLVIVTEDDPQGGVDHVDAHRSILMLAGPYVKKGYVSHKHANFGSILRTIYHILGVGYVNQYDATASLLDDFFTEIPDYKPYKFAQTDDRIFNPKKAMKVYGRNFDWKKVKQAAKLDDEDEQREEHYKQKN